MISRVAVLSLLVLTGCRDNGVDLSDDVGSRDIQIVVEVNGEADRTVVRAYASALLPYSGRVTLSGGDRLVLHDEPGNELTPEPGTGYYVTTTARNSGRFAVDLVRPRDTSLRDRGAVVPPPFTLQPTTVRARWSDDVELRWDAGAGEYVTSVVIESACGKRVVRYLARDTGHYVVNGGEIARVTAPCTARVSIVRQYPYTSARDVFARATQTRTAEITLVGDSDGHAGEP